MKFSHCRDRRGRREILKFYLGSISLRPLRRHPVGVAVNFFKIFLPQPVQRLIIVTIFCSFTPGPVLAESVDTSIQSGISNYRQQNFKQAELDFSKAQKQQPDNPELNYNLANSHYKNGKYQEALKSYTQATGNATPLGVKQNSLYNSGNALFRLGKLEESIAAYQKVLELDPRDMDAKFNLEFVREKLKEKNQQDQKQNQPQEKDSDGNQNSMQNPSPENKGEDDGQDSAQQENQEPSPPQEPEQNSDPSRQIESKSIEQAQSTENSITKDQAEQWLNGLDEDLKKFSQKQARRKEGKSPDSGKDW